jgi:hypothetical protein
LLAWTGRGYCRLVFIFKALICGSINLNFNNFTENGHTSKNPSLMFKNTVCEYETLQASHFNLSKVFRNKNMHQYTVRSKPVQGSRSIIYFIYEGKGASGAAKSTVGLEFHVENIALNI